MKKLLCLLLLAPFFAGAQECKLISEKDPYTKATRLSTGFIFLDGGSVTIDADSKEIDVLFSIEGSDRCFDNNSTATVFLEGSKSKYTVRNSGTMNCEGLFHFIFKNNASTTPSVLQKFITQKINHITFVGSSKKELLVNISPADQQKIIDMGTCLVEEAKKLVK